MTKVFLSLLLLFCSTLALQAQMTVRGTVYDKSKVRRVEFVHVYSTGGSTTVTDSLGGFKIGANEGDSLYFVYQNKPTQRYAVSKIERLDDFEISLAVTVPERLTYLPTVKITTSYKQDSIENREHFKRAFTFVPNKVDVNYTGMGVGVDFDDLINLVRFKFKKQMKQFRVRLEDIERDAFIRQHFSRPLIVKLTGLEGTNLDSFMNLYLPSYEFAAAASNEEMKEYILLAFEKWKQRGTK